MISKRAAQARAEAATLRWIDELVIKERLCPWAKAARVGAGMRIVLISSPSQFPSAAASAAAELAMSSLDRPTTLIVLDSATSSELDVTTFARLCTRAATSADDIAPGMIDLLGFHPSRVDIGPGCVPGDVNEAAHFSVRSPLPTMQLLRRADIACARDEWAACNGSSLPGALALLYENKRRLREIGSDVLAAALWSWKLEMRRDG